MLIWTTKKSCGGFHGYIKTILKWDETLDDGIQVGVFYSQENISIWTFVYKIRLQWLYAALREGV